MSEAKKTLKLLSSIYSEFFLADNGRELRGALAEIKQSAIESGDFRHLTKILDNFGKVLAMEIAIDKDDKGDQNGQLKFTFEDDAPKVGGDV